MRTSDITRKTNLQRRYRTIQQRFDQLYAKRIEGMRPAYDCIIEKLANEFGYSERQIKKILKTPVGN